MDFGTVAVNAVTVDKAVVVAEALHAAGFKGGGARGVRLVKALENAHAFEAVDVFLRDISSRRGSGARWLPRGWARV